MLNKKFAFPWLLLEVTSERLQCTSTVIFPAYVERKGYTYLIVMRSYLKKPKVYDRKVIFIVIISKCTLCYVICDSIFAFVFDLVVPKPVHIFTKQFNFFWTGQFLEYCKLYCCYKQYVLLFQQYDKNCTRGVKTVYSSGLSKLDFSPTLFLVFLNYFFIYTFIFM